MGDLPPSLWGTSGRSGGQVDPGLKLGRDALMRLHGAQTGTLRLAHTEAALRALYAAAATLQGEGAPITLLDRAETARMTGSARYRGGLAQRARALGARILFPAPMGSLTRQDGAWRIAAGTDRCARRRC